MCYRYQCVQAVNSMITSCIELMSLIEIKIIENEALNIACLYIRYNFPSRHSLTAYL